MAEAKKKWLVPREEQLPAFPEREVPLRNEFNVSGISDGAFWEQAEERIYEALKKYAEQVEAGTGFQRRLFAGDAARGFAFIAVCRKRYDVVLMNPPFGDSSLPSKPYLDDTYGDTRGDVYKAFVECFQARLIPASYLGILSSRSGFFLGQSEDWRTRVVLRLFRPIVLADLGSGVLDAMVEVAGYVLRSLSMPEARDLTLSFVPSLEKVERDRQDRFSLPKWQAARDGLKRHQAAAELERLEAAGFIQRCLGDIVRYTPLWQAAKKVTAPPKPVFPPLVCIRVIDQTDKRVGLIDGIDIKTSPQRFIVDPGSFDKVEGAPFCYWVGDRIRNLFCDFPPFASDMRDARVGPSTGDDARRVRCWWEVSPLQNTREKGWASLSKGGSYSPFYFDVHLVVAWDQKRFTYAGFFGRPGRMLEKLESSDCLFRPCLTWPRRTTSGLALRILPAGAVFADKSPVALVKGDSVRDLLAVLGLTSSRAFQGLVALQLAATDAAARSYEVGLIKKAPFPNLGDNIAAIFGEFASRAWRNKRDLDTAQSVSHAFLRPALLAVPGFTLAARAAAWAARVCSIEETVAVIQAEIDDLAFRLYGLDAADRAALTATLDTESTDDAKAGDDEEEAAAPADAPALTADLLALSLIHI